MTFDPERIEHIRGIFVMAGMSCIADIKVLPGDGDLCDRALDEIVALCDWAIAQRDRRVPTPCSAGRGSQAMTLTPERIARLRAEVRERASSLYQTEDYYAVFDYAVAAMEAEKVWEAYRTAWNEFAVTPPMTERSKVGGEECDEQLSRLAEAMARLRRARRAA